MAEHSYVPRHAAAAAPSRIKAFIEKLPFLRRVAA